MPLFQHFAQTGDYLGGEAFWAGGLHLYTPLPFRPGQGGFGDLFRTHFFLNAGNLCNLNYGKTQQNKKHASSLHIKAKRTVVLCLFTQKHFVYCQKPAALTCIFDRLPVVYLALSIIFSTTCRKESQEGNSSVCEQVMFADQCVTNTCFLTPFEGRMNDDVFVGFWCLLGRTKEKVVVLDEGVEADGTLFPLIPNSIQDTFQCV